MDYSAANTTVWSAVITFGIIGTVVLLSNILRLKISIVKKSLFPTAVIAGFLLLAVKELGWIDLDINMLSIITFHSVAIGFIAITLRLPKESARTGALLGFKTGATALATYMIQIIVGMGIAFILAATVRPDFFTPSGILLALGFGQGPGQANNIGASYEALGFAGGQSFGLALAAMGYVIAFVVGVLRLHAIKRKRADEGKPFRDEEPVGVDFFQDDEEAPVSESIDRLSIQVALVMFVYLLSYLFIKALLWGIGLISPGGAASLSGTIWGFNFIAGVLLAALVRIFIRWLRNKGLMRHQYQNNYLLSRISGCAFDFMIVAGIAAIDLRDLSGLWMPFLLMSAVGGLVTYFFLDHICKHVYKEYSEEAFLTMFGTWTGTISSGMILLREIDPEFQTPAANNIIIGSSYGIVLGIPLLLIISGAPGNPLMWYLVAVGYFAVLTVIIFLGVGPKGDARRAARAEKREAKRATRG